MKQKLFSNLLDTLVSVQSENGDVGKNIISIKLIIKAIISIALMFLITLGLFLEGRHVELVLIIIVTLFTLFLIKNVQSPKIKVFFFHKLSQSKTKTKEKFISFQSSISIFRKNKVCVQNMVQEA